MGDGDSHPRGARREGERSAPLLPRARLEHRGRAPHPGEPQMKVCVAGQGAFGQKHLEAIQNIQGVEVVSLTGGNPQGTKEVAQKFKVPHWTSDLAESLKQPGVEAAILATPTQMHARQAIQCMRAGKHVQVEIPMADTLADSREIVKVQKETGLVAMAGHTRRFNPSHL